LRDCIDEMINPLLARPPTRERIILAMGVAVVADGLQFMASLIAGPMGWVFFV